MPRSWRGIDVDTFHNPKPNDRRAIVPVTKLDQTVTRDGEGKRFFAVAGSNERVKKALELCGGDAKKLAEAIGRSPTHIRDIVTGNEPCAKVTDMACEAVLRRFQQEGKHPARTLMTLRMNDEQSGVIRPLLKALDIRPGLDMITHDEELNSTRIVVFPCDHVHYATLYKLITVLKIEHYTFQ